MYIYICTIKTSAPIALSDRPIAHIPHPPARPPSLPQHNNHNNTHTRHHQSPSPTRHPCRQHKKQYMQALGARPISPAAIQEIAGQRGNVVNIVVGMLRCEGGGGK